MAIWLTTDSEANELLEREPLALVIGMLLDQQITIEVAFLGPKKIFDRIGSLDARTIAEYDPDKFAALCSTPPAIHRFPGSMAKRVQELCAVLAEDYDGDAERVWGEATDTGDLRKRIGALPGFGDMKITALGSVLALHFGVEAAQELVPEYPCLGKIHSPEDLAEYQAAKRAHKAAQRAAAASG
jgi:uncharacterized HhH-GPD family protein